MKKVIFLGFVFISVLIFCKKEIEMKMKEPATASEKMGVEEPELQECYRAILKKDTILLTLNINHGQFSQGNSSYNFFKKDKKMKERLLGK